VVVSEKLQDNEPYVGGEKTEKQGQEPWKDRVIVGKEGDRRVVQGGNMGEMGAAWKEKAARKS